MKLQPTNRNKERIEEETRAATTEGWKKALVSAFSDQHTSSRWHKNPVRGWGTQYGGLSAPPTGRQ